MKITVMGGTGYLGQGILATIIKNSSSYDLISMSRSGDKNKEHLVRPITYMAVDFNKSGEWQQVISSSDVVIDCVGIFLPSKRKNTNYYKNSVQPAKQVIDEVATVEKSVKFIFIGANAAPWFLRNYLAAKKEVIDYGTKKLDNQFVVVYPGMVYDRQRLFNYVPGILLSFAINILHMHFLKKYRPIKRRVFNLELLKIIQNKPSELTQKIK